MDAIAIKHNDEIIDLQTAKDECIKMWDWLRKNPTKDKWDYYGLDINSITDILPIPNGCNMCAYVGYHSNESAMDCLNCPIWGKSGISPTKHLYGCEDDNSPYRKWTISQFCENLPATKIYATEVLKLALRIKVGDI